MINKIVLFVLIAATMLSSGESQAATPFDYDMNGPMVFKAAYNGGNCNGCEWILAEGTIQEDTPERFKQFLAKKKPPAGEDLHFNSPGGNLFAAMKLGELIRAAGLHTGIQKTVGEQSSFDPDTIKDTGTTIQSGLCASACVYAFLGGVTRFTDQAKVGIHQFYDKRGLNAPLERTASTLDRSADQLLSGLLYEYVKRMGADPELVSMASRIPPWEDIKWLNDQELRELNIDNSHTTYTPLEIEPFGRTGAYVETVSRSIYYSFRHRVFCKGDKSSVYVVLISNSTAKDERTRLEDAFAHIAKQASITLLKADRAHQTFPIQLGALSTKDSSSEKAYASFRVVGANMDDFEHSKRVVIDNEQLDRPDGDIAYWLSFDLTGDRRKIGIASRSCLQ